jgi:prevent-host-death family protein
MQMSVSDAKAHLTDLVRRAEAGEDVILTRHGHPTVRITPLRLTEAEVARRLAVLEEMMQKGKEQAIPGPGGESNHDYLYDENGLPK